MPKGVISLWILAIGPSIISVRNAARTSQKTCGFMLSFLKTAQNLTISKSPAKDIRFAAPNIRVFSRETPIFLNNLGRAQKNHISLAIGLSNVSRMYFSLIVIESSLGILKSINHADNRAQG